MAIEGEGYGGGSEILRDIKVGCRATVIRRAGPREEGGGEQVRG